MGRKKKKKLWHFSFLVDKITQKQAEKLFENLILEVEKVDAVLVGGMWKDKDE